MISVALDKHKHDRNSFDCGVEALNNHLKLIVNQQSSKDNSRTFILEDENNPGRVIGYYTLTMSPINLDKLQKKLQKKHKNVHAGGLIARLAIDKQYTKQGFGEWLLIDALKKLLRASETVAFPVIIVDAKDGVIEFYKLFGFKEFKDMPNKLFITLADVRSVLE